MILPKWGSDHNVQGSGLYGATSFPCLYTDSIIRIAVCQALFFGFLDFFWLVSQPPKEAERIELKIARNEKSWLRNVWFSRYNAIYQGVPVGGSALFDCMVMIAHFHVVVNRFFKDFQKILIIFVLFLICYKFWVKYMKNDLKSFCFIANKIKLSVRLYVTLNQGEKQKWFIGYIRDHTWRVEPPRAS